MYVKYAWFLNKREKNKKLKKKTKKKHCTELN